MSTTSQIEEMVPLFKLEQAAQMLSQVKLIEVQLRNMRDATSLRRFNEFKSALVFSMNGLNLSHQTL